MHRTSKRMKSLKSLHLVVLASLIFIASAATTDAQTAQQASGQTQSDANAPKDKKKSAADSATPKPQAAPASAPASTPPASSSSTQGSTVPASKPAATQQTPVAKSASMVWVNTDSGVYHKRGTRWYGKTKKGKYMTEADALRAGYKPAKKE